MSLLEITLAFEDTAQCAKGWPMSNKDAAIKPDVAFVLEPLLLPSLPLS